MRKILLAYTLHTIDGVEDERNYMLPQRIVDLRSIKKNPLLWHGVGMRVLKNKRGDSFAFITLDDKSILRVVCMG